MIHVIATIELNPGRRGEFLAELRALVPTVLAEPGCIEYGPALDVATSFPAQGGARVEVVSIVERWADLRALEAHLAAPHMAAYRARVKDFVKAVKLQILQPA